MRYVCETQEQKKRVRDYLNKDPAFRRLLREAESAVEAAYGADAQVFLAIDKGELIIRIRPPEPVEPRLERWFSEQFARISNRIEWDRNGAHDPDPEPLEIELSEPSDAQ